MVMFSTLYARFRSILGEYSEEVQSRSKHAERSKSKVRNVFDELGFRALVVLTIGTYIVFFSVAIARVALHVDTTIIPQQRKYNQGIDSNSWYEYAGATIHSVFHFNWFGMFRHYKPTVKQVTEDGAKKKHDLWYVGVALSLVGTMVAALGNHLVTLAHKLDIIEKRKATTPRVVARDWIKAMMPSGRKQRGAILTLVTKPSFVTWLFGNVAITILGTLLTLASFAYASQALVAPLSGLTIVWNALLSSTRWFGNVALKRKDLAATFLTLAGCVFIVAAGPRSTKHFSLDALVQMFFRTTFEVYSVCAAMLIITLHRVGSSPTSKPKYKRFAFGMLPGIIGGFSNVLAKASVELVSQYALFSSLTSIMVLIVSATCAVLQLTWINRALQTYDPLFVVPVYQATLLISSTLAGALYYGEFEEFTFLQYCIFFLSICAIVLGVSLLASSADMNNDQTEKLEVDIENPSPSSTKRRSVARHFNFKNKSEN